MRDSLRMTFIMVMEDTFILMVIITQVIGSMVNGPDGANWSTSQAKFTKVCGNTVNLQEADRKYASLSRLI